MKNRMKRKIAGVLASIIIASMMIPELLTPVMAKAIPVGENVTTESMSEDSECEEAVLEVESNAVEAVANNNQSANEIISEEMVDDAQIDDFAITEDSEEGLTEDIADESEEEQDSEVVSNEEAGEENAATETDSTDDDAVNQDEEGSEIIEETEEILSDDADSDEEEVVEDAITDEVVDDFTEDSDVNDIPEKSEVEKDKGEPLEFTVSLEGARKKDETTYLDIPFGMSRTFKVKIGGRDRAKVDMSKLSAKFESSYPYALTYDFDKANMTITVTAKNDVFKAITNSYNRRILLFMYDGHQVSPSFHVNPELTTISKVTPTVSVAYATDTSITFNVGLPKNIQPEASNLGYVFSGKVVADKNGYWPSSMENIPGIAISAMDGGELRKQVEVQVANSSTPIGSGVAQKYNFDVYLVQCLDGKDFSDLLWEENDFMYAPVLTVDHDGNKAISKPKKITASSQNPCYETKLSIKPVSKTIIQGQENVLMATVSNSAKTTYRGEFYSKGVQILYKNKQVGYEGNITVDYMELEKGNLVITAKNYYGSYPAPSTDGYTYRAVIAAKNADDTKEVVSNFDFKVAPCINSLGITADKKSVYKKDGAAASVQYKVNAYDYENRVLKVNSKALKYEIVDASGYGIDDSSMNYYIKKALNDGTLAISNSGKVTIDKKCVVPSGTGFMVKVYAMDYDRTPEVVTYSDVCKIMTTTQKIKEIRAVTYSGGSVTTTPSGLPVNGGRYDLNNYTNGKFRAIFIAVDENGKYIPGVDFKCSSNNAIFEMYTDSNGTEYAYFETAQNLKEKYIITATTTDGTNSSAKFSFECTDTAWYLIGAKDCTMDQNPEVVNAGNMMTPTVKTYLEYKQYEITNNYLGPVRIVVTPRNGAKKNLKFGVYEGCNIVGNKMINGSYCVDIIPTAYISRVKIIYNNRTELFMTVNMKFSGLYKEYAMAGIENTSVYVNSKLEHKSGSLYKGYWGKDGNDSAQTLAFALDTVGGMSKYTYSSGDQLVIVPGIEDYINDDDNKKAVRKFIIGDDKLDPTTCIILPINSSGIAYWKTDYRTLSDTVKDGKYKFNAYVQNGSTLRSMPIPFEIEIRSTPKLVGDLSDKLTITPSKSNYVDLVMTGGNKCNVENVKITNVKNANINGQSSGFYVEGGEMFDWDDYTGKLFLRYWDHNNSKPPKGNKITGWVEYECDTPQGHLTNQWKLVTVTYK